MSRKVKKLRLGPLKTPGDANNTMLKILSCHFHIKTMFMGVVERQIQHCQFNGKIFLVGVRKKILISKITSHQKFIDDVIINQAIQMG